MRHAYAADISWCAGEKQIVSWVTHVQVCIAWNVERNKYCTVDKVAMQNCPGDECVAGSGRQLEQAVCNW